MPEQLDASVEQQAIQPTGDEGLNQALQNSGNDGTIGASSVLGNAGGEVDDGESAFGSVEITGVEDQTGTHNPHGERAGVTGTHEETGTSEVDNNTDTEEAGVSRNARRREGADDDSVEEVEEVEGEADEPDTEGDQQETQQEGEQPADGEEAGDGGDQRETSEDDSTAGDNDDAPTHDTEEIVAPEAELGDGDGEQPSPDGRPDQFTPESLLSDPVDSLPQIEFFDSGTGGSGESQGENVHGAPQLYQDRPIQPRPAADTSSEEALKRPSLDSQPLASDTNLNTTAEAAGDGTDTSVTDASGTDATGTQLTQPQDWGLDSPFFEHDHDASSLDGPAPMSSPFRPLPSGEAQIREVSSLGL